jgi:hypothetical protein
MLIKLMTFLVCVLIAMNVAVGTALAADFRLYYANKLLQQSKVSMVRNTDKPGCHNLFKKRRIYRVAQVGFETCAIYAEKDCAAGTEIEVRWKNKKAPTTTITPGARWFLPGERGSKMGSWKCEGES